MIIEGVTYYRFRVRFQLADGRRRVWIRWSPALAWLRDEVARELDGVDVKPGSCILEAA